MNITTFSSREFNQDTSGAKRAASQGPVFITDRGQPAHVLLTFEQYQRLATSSQSIVDLLAMSEEIEFEPPKASVLSRPADLS
jgi:PHD/YefM family antitoxin component YafN of YafNO toxin-antitoxin module